MRVAGLDYNARSAELRDIEPPEGPQAGEVLLRVREVGVCGTDRELAAFHIGWPPEGESFLVLGHEALGQVEAVGAGVTGLSKGDLVAPTVRRACRPPCAMCAQARRDLCLSGSYADRGVMGAHGYLAELAVDRPEDLVLVPPRVARFGVLVEPLSVVEKAVRTALRMHPGEPRTALVIGAGPIGLLSAMALAVRGISVTLHSKEPRDSTRARLAAAGGANYETDPGALRRCDLVIEAAGAPEAGFLALDRLATNGVCGLLGARPGAGEVPFRRMILENQVVFGSVNASPEASRAAVDDLRRFEPAWLDALIERRSFDDFPRSVTGPPGDAVKIVHAL